MNLEGPNLLSSGIVGLRDVEVGVQVVKVHSLVGEQPLVLRGREVGGVSLGEKTKQ